MHIDRAPLRFMLCVALVAGPVTFTLAGCSGEAEEGYSAPPATVPSEVLEPLPQAPPDSAEGILDAAAENWGGRRAMRAETGFHIKGEVLYFVEGREEAIRAGRVEVWSNYKPLRSRSREYVARVDPITGEEEAARNEQLQIVNDDKGWVTNLASGKVELYPALAENARKQPNPRKVLLHREHHLSVALDDKQKIAEMDGLEAWAILTKDPSGNECWAYVDMERKLRKITYKAGGVWMSAVFESYREDNPDGISRLEKARLYQAGKKIKSFRWNERESSPTLPDSLFQPPS